MMFVNLCRAKAETTILLDHYIPVYYIFHYDALISVIWPILLHFQKLLLGGALENTFS